MIKESQWKQLTEIDALFGDFYQWLAGQYDKKTGGFYYAKSSIDNNEFQPDIESTAQALNILAGSGLIHKMPEPMKRELIAFFQQRQQPESGYFYDLFNEMRLVDRMVARAVNYSVNSLKLLGAAPAYPIPGIGGVDTLPGYMKELQTFKHWLEERNWENSWSACDNISATSVYIEHLPDKEQKVYLDTVLEFLAQKQDSQTGMWGEGRPYIQISGTFKLVLIYRRFDRFMPRPDKILASLFSALRTDNSEDMCWTRNSAEVISAMQHQIPEIITEDISEFLDITLKNLKRYLKKDGGFSRHIDNSMRIPNEMPLGMGLAEGDMNAGTQALRIRSLCYEIVGEQAEPLKEYIEGFYKSAMA